MSKEYQGVITRFLRPEERFILSEEKELPLVIEADGSADIEFLHQFLATNSTQIIHDMAQYGAVLLRGFNVLSDAQFEQTVLSIPEFRGISDAFMSENGRVQVGDLKYVLHTNSVYKTGGTLYLGGFHTENYYSADVPGHICFYCIEPSVLGGETGLINTEKIYRDLNDALKQKLEKNTYFVSKWKISEVAERYQIDAEKVEKLCENFDLPVVGEGDEKFVLMYKPSVLEHPITNEKALQINLFEVQRLNRELRKCFMKDYQGNDWFWHRFFWKLPDFMFHTLESLALIFIAFFHSPKNSFKILKNKIAAWSASRSIKLPKFDMLRVGSCFNEQEIKDLAQSMRSHYSSCLWQKGDILLIDNRKVMHAGMPGTGARLIRAMICNPIEMGYSLQQPGCIDSKDRTTDTIGTAMNAAQMI